MTTSTVASIMPRLFLIVLGLALMASAQTIMPTNATLPPDEQSSMIPLKLFGGPFPDQPPFNIAPLTVTAGRGASAAQTSTINYAGIVRLVGPSNVTITKEDIAFISCDDSQDSNMHPADVLTAVGGQTPKGIVLYSKDFNECNLTGPTNFQTIYTMTKLEDTQKILDTFSLYPDSTNYLKAQVGNSSANGGPPQGTNEGGPAPTTAVAMSILYSITGIITLLFLIIIATGAVRAHRHPERYGPRTGYSGRPRQSRAKGLARAMLETLPIVKFGDPESVKPGSRDIELENGSALSATPTRTAAQESGAANTQPAKTPPTTTTPVASGADATKAEAAVDAKSIDAPASASSIREPELGCSICTEDFVTGEDVRVLPCQHKYHPACVDPWLLNVSGTCPLCRRDLRPEANAEAGEAGSTGNDELSPPLNEGADNATQGPEGVEDPTSTRHRRRSRLLDLTRLRHAPPQERIAALRQLREQSRAEGEGNAANSAEDSATQQSRRTRLAGRLRDRFRVRTTGNPPSQTQAPPGPPQ